MEWEFIVALVIAIPIILLPVAFIWYLNLGGVLSAAKRLWKKRAARQKPGAADVKVQTESITTPERRG